MTFGEHFEAMRLARGLTLKRLGHQCGVTHSHLSRMERDLKGVSPATMRKIVAALDLTDAEITALAVALWREDNAA